MPGKDIEIWKGMEQLSRAGPGNTKHSMKHVTVPPGGFFHTSSRAGGRQVHLSYQASKIVVALGQLEKAAGILDTAINHEIDPVTVRDCEYDVMWKIK